MCSEHICQSYEKRISIPKEHTPIDKANYFLTIHDMMVFVVKTHIMDVLTRCHVGGNKFQIKGKTFRLRKKEVGTILGLIYKGKDINLNKNATLSSSWGVLLRKCINYKDEIKVVLEGLLEKQCVDDGVVKDIVRLWLLYLFFSVLFVANRYRITRKFMDCMEDLDKLHEINWSGAIHSLIFSNMDNCCAMVIDKNAIGRVGTMYLDGCSMVLMVWKETEKKQRE